MLLVHEDSSPGSFLPQFINELSVNLLECMVGSDVTFPLGCHKFPFLLPVNIHMCIAHSMMQHHGPCVIYIANLRGFNGAYCDCSCFTLIAVVCSTLCAKFMYSLYYL